MTKKPYLSQRDGGADVETYIQGLTMILVEPKGKPYSSQHDDNAEVNSYI